jgi:hypothetical protein
VDEQESKLKRRGSVKQPVRQEVEKVTKKVVQREQIDELTGKIAEVQIEASPEVDLPEDEIPAFGEKLEKPRVSEVPVVTKKAAEKKPVLEKAKKKSIPTPVIEPLMPSTETPEEMVSQNFF